MTIRESFIAFCVVVSMYGSLGQVSILILWKRLDLLDIIFYELNNIENGQPTTSSQDEVKKLL